MYIYTAYGLCIHSAFELSGLPRGGTVADVTIHRRPLSVSLGEKWSDGGRIVSGRIYDDLKFVIKDGTDVFIDPEEHVTLDLLRSYILGVLMATLLRQRGLLVLHACAVANGDHAIGFVGESGWGKSTLAEYFCQHGYRLLTDDVLAIRVGEQPVAIPSYPQVRLRAEAAKWLRKDCQQMQYIKAQTEKWVHASHAFTANAVPLSKLYVLSPTFAARSKITPFSQQAALITLVQHTRAMNLISDTSYMAAHLQQCANLIKTVPVARLDREKRLDGLSDIYQIVERDLMASDLAQRQMYRSVL